MTPIVLAYSGGFNSSIAAYQLAETYATDIVTVTVDVGQGHDLGELRRRATSCGAVRAHAIDARDELAREFLQASLRRDTLGAGGYPRIDELPRPLIARKLIEIAGIEGARSVAHGSFDRALDECIRAIDPAMTVLAPAREWHMGAAELAEYARTRGIAPRNPAEAAYRIDRNLWGRIVSWQDGDKPPDAVRPPDSAWPAEQARLDIRVEQGVPVSINGVPMSPAELVESLALIAGRHGVGRLEAGDRGRRIVCDAPAALVLHTALAAAGERGGVVSLAVRNGRYDVLTSPESVTHP